MFEERKKQGPAPKPRKRCGRCNEILNPENKSGYCRECRKALGMQAGAAVTGNPGRPGGIAMTITRRAK